MKSKIVLFSIGVIILSLSPVRLVFAAAGAILDSFPASPGVHAHGGAAFGGLVWQSDDNGNILEFACDGSFLRTINSQAKDGLAYDPNTNTFWRADGFSIILHLDINGAFLGDAIFAGRQIYALTLDPNTRTLWGGRSGFLHQFDIATGNFLRTIPAPTGSPFPSLAFDGQFLWFSHFGSGTRVWQINPDAGQILQTFLVSGNGGVVAHDSQDLWTFSEGSDQIQRVDDGIGPSGLPCFRGGVVEVDIDIKPGSDPNSINQGSSGVIPIAILSTADFDAPAEIDPDTISLAGARVKMVGKSNKLLCHSEDVNADGLADLVCKVETAQFMIEIGDSIAVLEADTFGGTPVRGEDSIKIVP